MRKNKKNTKKSLIVTLVAVVFVVLLGLFLFQDSLNLFDKTNDEDSTINYDPPTEEEKQQVDKHKEQIVDTPQDEPQPSNGEPKAVNPFITVAQQFNDTQYGDRIEVHAYIPEIIESGGTCTYTFTKGAEQVTWEVDAQPDARTTNCDVAMTPREKFPSVGKWSVVVAYKSSNARGISDAVEVEVQ